jgi:hypothetical protein
LAIYVVKQACGNDIMPSVYVHTNIQSEALASSREVGTYIQLKLRYVSI